MIWWLYYTLMYGMVMGIRLASIGNPKAALWIKGRKNWKSTLHAIPEKQAYRIWFHVSSLGEFEQARPVLEEIKRKRPEVEIFLSFFSPSGFEIRKAYELAQVVYLPADLPGNAEEWMAAIRPDLAVFVKYDLWPGYLRALARHHIPFLIISAHFVPGTFSSWSIPPANGLLKKANAIFLQNNSAVSQLQKKGFQNIHVAGDTRIDRTLAISASSAQYIPEILKTAGVFDLIAGSTWEEDEKLLIPLIQQRGMKVIMAPHNISAHHIQSLLNNNPVSAKKLSSLSTWDPAIQILIVDSIGLLAYLYALGKMAYVGGGFGSGIHNILEPAAHRKPIIFGPRYHKFPEAGNLIQSGAALSVRNSKDLEKAITLFSGEEGERAGNLAKNYLERHQGATQIITTYILDSIPFSLKS